MGRACFFHQQGALLGKWDDTRKYTEVLPENTLPIQASHLNHCLLDTQANLRLPPRLCAERGVHVGDEELPDLLHCSTTNSRRWV